MSELMFVLSTSHLQDYTCNVWLQAAPFAAFPKGDYGWFVFVPEDLTEVTLPEDLRACCERACEHGCAWIMFDRDAPALDTLPVYDW